MGEDCLRLVRVEQGRLAKDLLKAKLPADTGPKEWFLTEYEDRSSPRPGVDEVYFTPSSDQSTVARPPVVEWQESNSPWIIGLAMCLGLPALTFVVLGVLRMRK